MTNVLIDKGVIRKLIESFVKVEINIDLTDEQKKASNVFRDIVFHHKAFITIETYNILRTKFYHQPFYKIIDEIVDVVIPVRYTRRWARRLRQFGISREDAWQVAMSTFCTDKIIQGELINIGIFLTLDKNLVERYLRHKPDIEINFYNMIQNLNFPYSSVLLPKITLVEDYLLQKN